MFVTVFITTFVAILFVASIVRRVRTHIALRRALSHRLASLHARSYVSRDDMRVHQRIM